MSNSTRFRDSTEIVLPCNSMEEFRDDLEAEFTVTMFNPPEGDCRIIGSPVEIKAVNDYLARHGLTLQ